MPQESEKSHLDDPLSSTYVFVIVLEIAIIGSLFILGRLFP